MRIDYQYTPLKVIFTGILFSMLALLFYTNNLLLIPRFLSKRRYKEYMLLYAGLVLVVTLLFTGTLKYIAHHCPDIKAWMVSPLIFGNSSPDLSITALIREARPYYFALFIAGGLFAMSWYVANYMELRKRMELTEKKHLQTELDFLRSQINPHFLFNTLNNLYTLTVYKSDHAPEIVERLSTILRYFLYDSNTTTISLEKEKEMMQAYIELELLRLTNKEGLRFVIQTDKPYVVPPLLWVPVLENAFKHSTRFIQDQYDLQFSFTIEQNMMRIYSKNTFKTAEPPAIEGIGLANLRKRLELLYPGRYELRSGQEGDYYVTDVNIYLA